MYWVHLCQDQMFQSEVSAWNQLVQCHWSNEHWVETIQKFNYSFFITFCLSQRQVPVAFGRVVLCRSWTRVRRIRRSQIVESVNGLFLMIEITFLIRKIQSISLRPFPGFKLYSWPSFAGPVFGLLSIWVVKFACFYHRHVRVSTSIALF